MNVDRLAARGAALAAALQRRTIDRLAQTELPNGVRSEVSDDVIILSGRGLMRRFINDPILRRFGR